MALHSSRIGRIQADRTGGTSTTDSARKQHGRCDERGAQLELVDTADITNMGVTQTRKLLISIPGPAMIILAP